MAQIHVKYGLTFFLWLSCGQMGPTTTTKKKTVLPFLKKDELFFLYVSIYMHFMVAHPTYIAYSACPNPPAVLFTLAICVEDKTILLVPFF